MQLEFNTQRWDTGEPSVTCELIGRALAAAPRVEVIASSDIPAQCIAVDGAVVAFVDDYDAWDTLSNAGRGIYQRYVASVGAAVIFKQQFRRGAGYPVRAVSAGFMIPSHAADLPAGESGAERPIDLVAIMRTDEYGTAGEEHWMASRRRIVEQARIMAGRGYRTLWGRAASEQYLRDLYRTRVGFNWQGFGRLTYRVIEYLRAGVVTVTQPLGSEWPVREDVVLEDGITCIFCDTPTQFARHAELLLRDDRMMARIRRNGLELWNERLALPAMGLWYRQWIGRALERRAATAVPVGDRFIIG